MIHLLKNVAPKTFVVVTGVSLLTACTTPDASFITWGDDSGLFPFDQECDDPRFEGPGAYSVLSPDNLQRDATDCRALYEAGLIRLRPNFQNGVQYENPEYDPFAKLQL